MNKIALITDTACDLTEDQMKKYNVKVLPFRIIFDGKEYKDRIDISPEEVYDRLKNETPSSSLPSMKDMEDMFTQLEEEGYTHAIAITLSSGLSGISNALKLVSGNHEKITTYVCDSKSISLGEGLLVEECAKMIEQGKSFEEIVNRLPSLIKRTNVFFIVKTLEYLKKGGRIGKVAGTIGEILNIKPIIGIGEDGKYFTYDKVRGSKQAISKLISIVKEKIKEGKYSIYMMHGNGYKEAKEIFEQISNLENVVSSFLGGQISPVAGMHSGPGLVGVAVYKRE
ncbi:DegV family protein [Clostridium sp. MB40-C1]|uniref:DegV family protein n=1 Tax=Clostridium sp. MB40-C1 TaxID=3070996 RepID=UPI0027E02384|nr:DegV family protein [Clostridium sp. MB40-C1]WMJ80762.1 DegV family protein [Clostridium sp. MB40-C1]